MGDLLQIISLLLDSGEFIIRNYCQRDDHVDFTSAIQSLENSEQKFEEQLKTSSQLHCQAVTRNKTTRKAKLSVLAVIVYRNIFGVLMSFITEFLR